MARRLRRTVITGGVIYPAGTAESPELAESIPNPKAWEGEADGDVALSVEPHTDAFDAALQQAKEQLPEPPRAGRGSGVDAWRAYAEGLGISVPEDAGRDDIVALVDAR